MAGSQQFHENTTAASLHFTVNRHLVDREISTKVVPDIGLDATVARFGASFISVHTERDCLAGGSKIYYFVEYQNRGCA
jgi:hypothetical protein